MNQVFWGLKDNWWKQVYDGEYHGYGPNVFDEGLHEKDIEPGFYKSIKLASEYASDQLGKPLTLEHYKKIHQLACSHFSNLPQTVINGDADKIDHFRDTSCSCYRNLVKVSYAEETIFQKENRKYHFRFFHSIRWKLDTDYKIQTDPGSKKELDQLSKDCKLDLITAFSKKGSKAGLDVKALVENGNPFLEEAIESTELVNYQLKRTQERLGLSKPFASFTINAGGEETIINVNYRYYDPDEIENALHALINDYNQQIQTLPKTSDRSDEENRKALTYVAELFQNLEWLHPFFDGQGRTDLVLLGKLLTENGFNPSILFMPYYSTFEPLEKWINYLEKGIAAWKTEQEK